MPINWRSVNPTLLDIPFRNDVEPLLDESPYSWAVTRGYATFEEQKKLWDYYMLDPQHHPKAAPPGKSKHNFRKAIDVALDGSDMAGLQPDWNTSHPGWQWLFKAVAAHPRLHSGRSFGDSDHIEKWEHS